MIGYDQFDNHESRITRSEKKPLGRSKGCVGKIAQRSSPHLPFSNSIQIRTLVEISRLISVRDRSFVRYSILSWNLRLRREESTFPLARHSLKPYGKGWLNTNAGVLWGSSRNARAWQSTFPHLQ